MTLCDVIRVYTNMNGNFKGGTNNVMIKYNDMIDSRRRQQCTDDNHSSLVHASARDKPNREKGRFGDMDTPVPDADWIHVQVHGSFRPGRGHQDRLSKERG